jgi:hypothetical protein
MAVGKYVAKAHPLFGAKFVSDVGRLVIRVYRGEALGTLTSYSSVAKPVVA